MISNTLLPAIMFSSIKGAHLLLSRGNDGICVTKSVSCEPYIKNDYRAVNERILGLTTVMDKVQVLGPALQLLLVLIHECGEQDCCDMNYPTLSNICDVSDSTVKGWSKKLKECGFISTTNIGPNGLTFTLIDAVIGRSDLFNRIDERLLQSAAQIKATKVVIDNACRQALNSLL